MTQPATMTLDIRQRCTLMLKAAGWANDAIAVELDMTERQVRATLDTIGRILIPGISTKERPASIYTILYALGLADTGVPADELSDHVAALPERVRWLRSGTYRDAVASGEMVSTCYTEGIQ